MRPYYPIAQCKAPTTRHLKAVSVPAKAELTKLDAEMLINKITNANSNVFKNVVVLVQKKGYLVLGFYKPQDCLRKRIPDLSNSYICRLLKATETYLMLDQSLTYFDRVSESTFRPLQDVTRDDARLVWSKVTKDSDSNAKKRIGTKQIKQVMEQLGIAPIVTNVSKPTFTLKADLQGTVERYVHKATTSLLLPNATTRVAWKQFAKHIFQQLLAACPMDDDKLAA